jgi:hypothetical protein
MTGETLVHIAVGVLLASVGIRAYHHAIRKGDWLLYKLKLMGAFVVLYGGGIVVLRAMGQPFSTVLLGSILLGLLAKLIIKKPDSRYISKHVKRAVIERDLGDEEDYDPEVHHFDHIVPYSEGGDNSVKNLRLVSKRYNLRKGARRPRLRDFYDS